MDLKKKQVETLKIWMPTSMIQWIHKWILIVVPCRMPHSLLGEEHTGAETVAFWCLNYKIGATKRMPFEQDGVLNCPALQANNKHWPTLFDI